MNSRRNPFDKTDFNTSITEVHPGTLHASSCDGNCCTAFSNWLESELEILEERFRSDITLNSLRNSLLRDR